jgi:Tfp pilus assembly protein PilZ
VPDGLALAPWIFMIEPRSMNSGERPAEKTKPRVVSSTLIEYRLEGRDDLRILWVRNISNGGLFLVTDDPPPLGTRLQIALRVPGAGRLALLGEVVHIIDRKKATEQGIKAGAGVQFTSLSEDQKQALSAYIEGFAERLSTETGDISDILAPSSSQDASGLELVREARRILESKDHYVALDLRPDAEAAEIEQRILSLRSSLAQRPLGLDRAQYATLQNAIAQLTRLGLVLLNPHRRLDYDFRSGHVRAEERIEAARVGGIAVEHCRQLWRTMFPTHVERSVQHMKNALRAESTQSWVEAIEQGHLALELDPFNQDLRAAIMSWRAGRRSNALRG